jgi:hypothetical protein
MKVYGKFAMLTATMALGVAPALALAADPGNHPTGPPSTVPAGPPATTPTGPLSTTPTGPPSNTPPSNQGTAHKPSTPGPGASLPAKAKAYGKECRGESKTHVAGTPGTPFSQCISGAAKLLKNQSHS